MTRKTKKNLVLGLIFATGACSLIVEVVAFRVLSPYFGNTIFTASSVIGTVLGALSLGYYLGGILADKHGNASWVSGLVFASGLSVLVIEMFSVAILPWLAPNFSMTTGPLVSSIILFFLPSLFLGTLSPFSVAILHDDAEEGVARLTGAVFFWSTLGSIAGSLSSGFLLIPNFGIDRILIGVGLVLCALGLVPRLALGPSKRRVLGLLVMLFFSVTAITVWRAKPTVAGTIYKHDGVYESLTVRDGLWQGRPTRFFFQDSTYSAAMFLDQSGKTNADDMVFDYTKYYALYRSFNPDLKRALVIGGGAYTIPKALLQDASEAKVEVSEIEPSLIELGKKYFEVKDDPRLVNRVEDGRRVLSNSTEPYDFIFSDVYSSLYSIPGHFTTREFFQLSKNKLSDGGIFVANLIGDVSRQQPSFLFSELKTFKQAFPNAVAIADQGAGTRVLQNVLLVGVKSDQDAQALREKMAPLVRSLRGEFLDFDRFEWSENQVLTDVFSPIDHLTASAISRMKDRVDIQPNGKEMLAAIAQQLRYGSRALGTDGHERLKTALIAEAKAMAPVVETQSWDHAAQDGRTYKLTNVIARFNPQAKKRIIIGTHYDTRASADRDSKNPNGWMPGANDGGSGTAVLMELARIIKFTHPSTSELGIDLVWFDGEEGEPRGDSWYPIGSRYFAEHLSDLYEAKPIGGLIVDMVCAKDTVLRPEAGSLRDAPVQTESFWNLAHANHRQFFDKEPKMEVLDDHTELNKMGVPSFLVINLDYPAFHTTSDTLDKCSPKSLEATAQAVLEYVNGL